MFVFGHAGHTVFLYKITLISIFSNFTGLKEKCHSPRAPVIESAGVYVVLHSQSHCIKATLETEG